MQSSIGTLAAGATDPESLGKLIAPNWDNIAPEEMDHFLNGLDSAMNKIAVDPGGGRFLAKLINKPPSVEEAQLFRGGMRSLLLIGNFGELSVEGQAHPGMQKRLKYSASELDSTLRKIIDKMNSMNTSDRADIKTALTEDDKLGDRVLEAIDFEAREVGAPQRRRMQLRFMGKRIIKRLKQSPDMMIDEYVAKYEKIVSQPDSDEKMQKLMEGYMGKKAYQARLRNAKKAAKRWEKLKPQEIPIGYQLLKMPHEDEDPKDDRYRKGLRTLGVGGITTAAGLLLIAIDASYGVIFWIGVVAGVTVGPIIMFVALIMLLVQAIKGPQ